MMGIIGDYKTARLQYRASHTNFSLDRHHFMLAYDTLPRTGILIDGDINIGFTRPRIWRIPPSRIPEYPRRTDCQATFDADGESKSLRGASLANAIRFFLRLM